NAGSENAREFAGDTSWTDYSLQARVKPTSFGSGGTVGIDARVQGSTKFYRLALLPAGVQLQSVSGSSVTVLGNSTQTVSTGDWYTLRLDVSGSTITGYVNGAQVGSGSNSTYSKGRIGLQTLYAAASFDEVTVSSGGSAPTPSASATSAAASASASASATPSSPAASASASSSPTSGAVYVSPSGSDSAAGTASAPTTLTAALTKIAAGGTIYLRGGTYKYSTTITIAPGNDGTSSARKTLSAYPGETPVLDFSAMAENSANRGLAVNADYWRVAGIVVEYAGDNGIFVGGSNNIIERTITRYNHDSGLQISRIASDTPQAQWPANNLILSAESHDNADSDGEDADGFAAKLTVGTGNVFRYCVSHNNIDDGWDLYTKSETGAIGPVTIENSLAYNNGTLTNGTVNTNGDRNGYKLGGEDIPVNNIVKNSIAYKNGKHGFTYNSNPGTMTISGNVSIDNAQRNFSFDEGTSVFRSNTSCRFNVSGSNDKTVGDADSSNQFWTGSNGSRCSSYSGTMKWSFASDGTLAVTFG
ncbi:MAG: right-handed parallel beta-helix repeat-containing protein, partial [Micromonosporaceae bacterium]|nr:right-handed parallel beta-helix repeat-containing protein [Micromonosporaceae bacterium]